MFQALHTLREHPQIGRPAGLPYRELIITQGKSGYLALYRYDPAIDEVSIVRIRHQRQEDY